MKAEEAAGENKDEMTSDKANSTTNWKEYMQSQAQAGAASSSTSAANGKQVADMWPWEIEAMKNQEKYEHKEAEYTAEEWAIYETGWYWHRKKRMWLNKYDEVKNADQVVKYVAKNKNNKKNK